MKKTISIFLSVVMAATVIHFAVTVHYCGGNEVGSVISLSGKTIQCCGHVQDNTHPSAASTISSVCCNNIVTLYGIDNTFFPSYRTTFSLLSNVKHLISAHVAVSKYINEFQKITQYDTGPPGNLISKNSDLSFICTLRI